jgi:hypothetical protein
MFEVEGSEEKRVVIGYKMGTTTHFFSALSDLYHFYNLYSARKYVGMCPFPSFPRPYLTTHQNTSPTE